ncbi:uncharacterized protein LOC124543420 [Vanessa cardui]|uniref:uncharacterized protein LOC124543420 n=1 Tax=Vanessa cardui TaxID=171605 RepID=UPI001F13B577|nr:uncharacterized protein LOC124543420 [Vanessa cardui]
MGMKVMIFAGVTTLIQAVVQVIFSSISVAQYYCLVDFLRELPFLIYIRILYYHNPDQCGIRVNIGNSIDGIADQAFVLMTREPLTVTRTFIINCVSLCLGVLWLLTSAIIMTGGLKNDYSKPIRWPWIMVSVCICALDVVATVIFANDSFYTKTLADIMDYVDASANGTGNVQLDTSLTAWIMVLLYSRFGVFFLVNLLLIILVAVNKTKPIKTDIAVFDSDHLIQVEAPTSIPVVIPEPITPTATQDAGVQSSPVPSVNVAIQDAAEVTSLSEPIVTETMQREPRHALSDITEVSTDLSSAKEYVGSNLRNDYNAKIPRADFSQAFRRMKKLLFFKSSPPPRRVSVTNSLDISPDKSPRMHHEEDDKKRTVNFPDNLLSLPQRLENMIAEQQMRLDCAVINMIGQNSTPRTTQSLPQLNVTNQPATPVFNRERRGTAAELQGQLPWAYIPASAHRMRDQLPPDEDLPPVPLPDYTAISSFRKASVHRAASSLSSLTQKRNYFMSQNKKSSLTETDVLY